MLISASSQRQFWAPKASRNTLWPPWVSAVSICLFKFSLSLSPLTPAIQNPPVPYMPWTRYFLSILLLDKNSLTITKPHFYYCTLSLSLSLIFHITHSLYLHFSLNCHNPKTTPFELEGAPASSSSSFSRKKFFPWCALRITPCTGKLSFSPSFFFRILITVFCFLFFSYRLFKTHSKLCLAMEKKKKKRGKRSQSTQNLVLVSFFC